MKVWIVLYNEYDGFTLHEVFSSLEKAQEYVKNHEQSDYLDIVEKEIL